MLYTWNIIILHANCHWKIKNNFKANKKPMQSIFIEYVNFLSLRPSFSMSFVFRPTVNLCFGWKACISLSHTVFLNLQPKQGSSVKFCPPVLQPACSCQEELYYQPQCFPPGNVVLHWGPRGPCPTSSYVQPSPQNFLPETTRPVNQVHLIAKAQIQFLKYFNPQAKIWPKKDKVISSFNHFNAPPQIGN